MVFIAIVLIGCLIFVVVGTYRNKLVHKSLPLNPPATWIITIIGGSWAVFLYGIVLLAFGILPSFPSLPAIGNGFLLAIFAIYIVPRWTASTCNSLSRCASLSKRFHLDNEKGQ